MDGVDGYTAADVARLFDVPVDVLEDFRAMVTARREMEQPPEMEAALLHWAKAWGRNVSFLVPEEFKEEVWERFRDEPCGPRVKQVPGFVRIRLAEGNGRWVQVRFPRSKKKRIRKKWRKQGKNYEFIPEEATCHARKGG